MHAICAQCRNSIDCYSKDAHFQALSLSSSGASESVGKPAGCSPATCNEVAIGLIVPQTLQ